MLRLSTLFLRTLRDDPSDAEVPSHKVLVRAGYVRRWSPGVYSLLPLGQIVYDKIARIVREELEAIGAQQVTLPALVPRSVFDRSGRWDDYGDTLFRLQDRKDADYLLAPTHEELFTLMVKDLATSYKDFPVTLFQIQTKYRDELRPRSGIIRGREFVMADSYSFGLDDEALEASYQDHRRAFSAMFDRMGLRYHVVSAISGAMGGSASEEFLAEAEAGEDTFALCRSCGYAANVEAVTASAVEAVSGSSDGAPERLSTPGLRTITEVVDHLASVPGHEVDAGGVLKSLVFLVDGVPTMVLVPGDRDVHLGKLEAILGAEPELLSESGFAARPYLARGFLGPIGMQEQGVAVWADVRVATGTSWVAGGNERNLHLAGVEVGRDFVADRVVDVASALEGDPCPRCGEPLHLQRAIEVGHIFQLGRKYAEAFELSVQGEDGRSAVVTMGSYGVGVTRAIGVIAEQTLDDRGLCWGAEVGPAHVHLVAVPTKDGGQVEAAFELGAALEAHGFDVLVDDRPGVSAGVRFKDAELLGVPTIVVIGRRLAEGLVELKDRRTGATDEVELAGLADRLAARG